MVPQICVFGQFSLQHFRNTLLHGWDGVFINTGIPEIVCFFLCEILSGDPQKLEHLGISPHARSLAVLQDDMPDAKSGRSNDLIVLQKSLPALFQLSVVFLQLNAGGFFFFDLRTGAPVVADKQRNNDSGDHKDPQNKYSEMLPYQIEKAVGIQAVGIAVSLVLPIINAKHVDSPIKELQQSFTAHRHAVAPVIALA